MPAFEGHWLSGRSAFSATFHLGALFAKNCFAREADPVAFNRKHLYQDLVAFLQFVANVFNAMFGNFADVEETIGSGQDFDKCTEIGQP